jgi:hypothetical protein
MKTKKLTGLLVTLAVLTLSFGAFQAVAQVNIVPADIVVNAGGDALVVSPPPEGGNARLYPVDFAVVAGFGGPGTTEPSQAIGYLNFVFGRAFSRDWGAVDFVPNVDKLYLSGKITRICKDSDGVIQLSGEMVTELDFNLGAGATGVVYLEEVDDRVAIPPFVIKVGGNLGPNKLILRWCQLPEFPIRVTFGVLKVDGHSVPSCS